MKYQNVTLICLLVLGACANSIAPIINSGNVNFYTGSNIKYTPHSIIHNDPEEAHRRNEPVAISEKPELVTRWERLIIITAKMMYEEEVKRIRVFNYKGELVGTSPEFMGNIYYLCKANRIFLGQISSHYLVKASYLLDIDGNIIREIKQEPDVYEFGFSKDEKVLWVLSAHIANGIPVTLVQLYDIGNGDYIGIKESTKSGVIKIEYEGKEYEVIVGTPQVPG